jgi:hypothetical protein
MDFPFLMCFEILQAALSRIVTEINSSCDLQRGPANGSFHESPIPGSLILYQFKLRAINWSPFKLYSHPMSDGGLVLLAELLVGRTILR